MGKEDERNRGLTGPSQTGLELFHFQPETRLRSQTRFFKLLALDKASAAARKSHHRIDIEGKNMKHSLKLANEEASEQIGNIASSEVCSRVFLKIDEELPAMGASEQETLDFFSLCLRFNSRLSHRDGSQTKRSQFVRGEEKRVFSDKGFLKIPSLLADEIDNQPTWFVGSKMSWKDFLTHRADFSYYLYPEMQNKEGEMVPRDLHAQGKYTWTFMDALPDWMTDIENGAYPSRETIVKELNEDIAEKERLLRQSKRTVAQFDEITNHVNSKWAKAAAYLELRKRDILPEVETFEEMILYLGFFDDWTYLNEIPSADLLKGMNHDEIVKRFKEPNDGLKSVVDQFLSSPKRIMSKELVALWLERKLKDEKMNSNAALAIDGQFATRFEIFFDRLEGNEVVFKTLKDTDRVAYNTFNYALKPLLQIFTQDERDYLRHLVSVYRTAGTPIGQFIWDIADLVQAKFRFSQIDPNSTQAQKLTSEVKVFAKSWLLNNYLEAFGQLKKLFPEPAKPIVQPSRSIKEEESDAAFVQDLEEEPEKISAGNLEGWNLYYATHRSVEPKYLKLIGGHSLKEREEALEEYIGTEKIPCQVSAGLLVRALDSAVVTPEEDELRIPTETVNGETFKKDKHGQRTRLMYRIDHLRKKIIFFIYLKRAFEYHFDRR